MWGVASVIALIVSSLILGPTEAARSTAAPSPAPIIFVTVHQLGLVPYDVDERIVSAHPDGSQWKRVYDDHAAMVNGASRSTDHVRIVLGDLETRFGGCRITAVNVRTKQATTIIEDASAPPCATDPRWSPLGPTILFGRDRNLFTIRADGTGETQLTSFTRGGSLNGWDWSPDGTQIVFAHGRAARVGRLYVMDADGSNIERIARCRPRTCGAQRDSVPRWSPDGDVIAFLRARNIQLLAPDGSGLHTLTTCPPGFHLRDCTIRRLAWSANGNRLAFTRTGPGVWIVPSDGNSNPHLTGIKRGYVLAWSS
jgi:Tol biopolymer transport system component